MEKDISDEKKILNEAFITWYNARYKELVASELLVIWERIDAFIQIGIAVTAAGSGVAGWQLWNIPEMKIVWAVISGIISLMAIGHKVFCIADKIKVWYEAKQSFAMIKNQLEILRYEVKVSFKENHDNINKRYIEIKKIFAEADSRIPNKDLWLTESLKNRSVSNVLYDDTQKTNFEEELKLSRKKYQSALERTNKRREYGTNTNTNTNAI